MQQIKKKQKLCKITKPYKICLKCKATTIDTGNMQSENI